MEGEGVFRSWDELIPDALGVIFSNLSHAEKLAVVPRVCKSWGKVVMGPCCWQEIDMEEWSTRSDPDNVDRMLRMLIRRSGGSLRKLCVSALHSDFIFSFIADHAGSLQTLRLPRSNMTDTMVEQKAASLSAITFIDLSYCEKIGARSLEAIGKHCKSLTGLRRNMHPINRDSGKLSQEDEARAIAVTMPKLKWLEIAYLLVDTGSVLEIICGCPELELLDLRGCWDVRLDEKYLHEKVPKLKVLGPLVLDQFERNGVWEFCSDYSDDSFYETDRSDGMWDDGAEVL
ncbi:hypothetical protein NMG60_11031400 [Bertholletia excelsa]